jgi:hypothetical protein
MLNFCGIVMAILKMVTGRNFSMSGINSGHHYLPTYQILMNFRDVCHFQNGCQNTALKMGGKNSTLSDINILYVGR